MTPKSTWKKHGKQWKILSFDGLKKVRNTVWSKAKPKKQTEIGKGEGFIALQIHDGGGIKVRWKEFRIKEL